MVVIVCPWQPDKYGIQKTAHELSGPISIYTYRDIDNDGNSDKLRFINFRERGFSSVVVYRNNRTLGQWNLKGTWNDNRPMFMVNDYDQDGVKEIFLFTHHENSVLLHGLAPLSKDSMIVENRTIFEYGTRDSLPVDNITAQQGGFVNLDDHPSRELYFSLTTGFNKKPRGVAVYNFEKDSLHYRSLGGVCLKNFHHIETEDRDFPLLTGGTWAHGNYPPDTTFTDMKSWLMVFDRDLEFLFEPVPFDEHPMQLLVESFRQKGETFLLVYSRYYGDRKDIAPTLYVYDMEGNKIREKSFPEMEKPKKSGIMVMDDALFLISGEGEVNKLDHQLQVRKTRTIEDISHGIPLFTGDINGNGLKEFVFRGEGRSGLVVADNRLQHPVSFSLEGDRRRPEFSVKKNGEGDRFLFVQSKGDITEFSYFLNPLYRFRYLLYAGLFAVIWLMVWSGKKLRAWYKYRKNHPREEIDELKVKSLRNVAEPHLTFNVLNALSAMLYNDEPEKANKMVIKYAKLLKNYL
ncbi:MAG: histidine kinase, partial [Bacteroidota bacterium]